jgi:catechol 2,3-dioxygenase-like lactoylglutathione lyase family enzyme
MGLEVVTLPVSDVDRAKRFYEVKGFKTPVRAAARSRCGAVVFVDQSAESVAALDLSAARWRISVCRVGREQRESAVGALAVVMDGVNAEH